MNINESIDNKEVQKDIELLIKRLTKCALLCLEQVEKEHHDGTEVGRFANTFSRITLTLIKLLELKGVKFESEESLTELLSKINTEIKNVEEVMKHGR